MLPTQMLLYTPGCKYFLPRVAIKLFWKAFESNRIAILLLFCKLWKIDTNRKHSIVLKWWFSEIGPIKYLIFNFLSLISQLTSFIFHLSSLIFHPSSFIFHLSSLIFHLSSFIFHLLSFISHPSFFISYLLLSILHTSSFISHLSSLLDLLPIIGYQHFIDLWKAHNKSKQIAKKFAQIFSQMPLRVIHFQFF